MEEFVTVTVPSGLETTRIGIVTRPRAVDTLAVDDVFAELAMAAVPVRGLPVATDAGTRVDADVARVTTGNVVAVTVRCGRLAATFGLGIAADDMVGVSVGRVAVVVAFAIVVPAVLLAAWFGEGIATDDIVGVCVSRFDVARFVIVVPAGLMTAWFGEGIAADDIVGVNDVFVVVAPMFDCVTVGPAANWPGVAAMAAVVGVMREALVGAFVAPTETAPVALVPTAPMKAPASPSGPLMTTGVGGELIDAFTVTSGFAVADGGMNWPVGGVGPD